MKKVKLISGDSPEQFVENYNSIMAGLELVDSQEFIDTTTMYVFYEEEEKKPCRGEGRTCAECLAYEWGRKCRLHGCYKRPMDAACDDIKWGSYITEEEEEYWRSMDYENYEIQN